MARPWRNCTASMTLGRAVDSRWPLRDRASDGTIGDAEHATRDSDHNPWVTAPDGMPVVRARDIDVDGIDAGWLAEQLRIAGANGDRRLRNGGYVIFNRRMTTKDFSGWTTYTGVNPHDTHIHVSFSLDPAGYDSADPWEFLEGSGFLAGLTDAQEQQILVAIANCWVVSGQLGDRVDLGTAVARIHHWLRTQPVAGGETYGRLSNDTISVANQMFHGNDTYGPSVLARLDELNAKLDDLAPAQQ